MNRSTKDPSFFVVTYRDPKDGEVVSLKAESIRDSTLGLGFIAISGFLFDKNRMVVTPDEEAQMKRLEGVKSLHLSIYCIQSVKEIGKEHRGLKFRRDRGNLVILPSPDSGPKK